MDNRFEASDTKIDGVAARLDGRMSRQFTWLVGIQVGALVAILAVLAGR